MVVQKRGVFGACDDEGKVVLFVEHAKKWTFSENGHCSLNSCFELHNKHLLFSSVNFAISVICFSPLIRLRV